MLQTDKQGNSYIITKKGLVKLKLNFEKKTKTIGNVISKNGHTIYYKRIKNKMNKIYQSGFGFNAHIIDSSLKDSDYIGVYIDKNFYGDKWKVTTKQEFLKYATKLHYGNYETQYLIEEYYLNLIAIN